MYPPATSGLPSSLRGSKYTSLDTIVLGAIVDAAVGGRATVPERVKISVCGRKQAQRKHGRAAGRRIIEFFGNLEQYVQRR